MRIGIDIRKYNDFGIGTYIQNLVTTIQTHSELDCIYFANDELKGLLKTKFNGNIVVDNSSKYSVKELFSISRKANHQHLDVFHTPHYTLPFNLRMPSIVTIHDIIHLRLKEYYSLPQRMYAYGIIKHACSASSAIIVDSEFGKTELLNVFTIDEAKIHVVPLGVGQEYYNDVKKEQIEIFKRENNIEKPYILYTGSLKPHKNIPVLLKAFKILLSKYDLQLVFTGEKLHDVAQLQNIVANNNLADAVIDLGKIEQSELRIAYRAAAVVVLPSLYEGFGFSMLEAMASGVPAIGARATSITEVIGNAGLLFNPYDESELAEQVGSVLRDSNLRSELILKGIERAKQFTWKNCSEKTLKIYKEVLQ